MISVDEQLSVEVPTHLFGFEERIFGLTITQLLSDTAAGAGIWALWSMPLPLPARIALCVGAALLTILIVHVYIKGHSLVEWGSMYLLYWLAPPKTVWYNAAVPRALLAKKQAPPARPSVQSSWMSLRTIANHCLVFEDGKQKKGKQAAPPSRYSAVLEVSGINFSLLAVQERLRIFNAYKTFLAGLEFPLQTISCNETVDVQSYEPLQLLKQQLEQLQSTPRLAALAQNHLQFLQKRLGTNIVTRHYVVISASPFDEEMKRVDGKSASGFLMMFRFLARKKGVGFSEEQVLRQLRIRLKVMRDGFRDMGLRTWLLDDEALARFYASSLVPGTVATWGERAFDGMRPMIVAPPEASISSSSPELALIEEDEIAV
jgi:hypothetical protein